MRLGVRAAEHAGRAMPRTLARGVCQRDLVGFDDKIKRHAKPAAKLAVAGGIGQKFMVAKMQREARFGNLQTAKFQAADRMPLADRRPAVAAGGGAATRTRMKKVPDKAAASARVLALDCDAETPTPASHHAIGTTRRHRLDDGFHNFIGRMAGA